MSKVGSSVLLAASVSLFLWAMPAWAGHHHGKHGKGHHGTSAVTKGVRGGSRTNSVTDADDSGGKDTDASTHPGSNKGGAVRGLERANEVAGEHGEAGRENAAHHGKH